METWFETDSGTTITPIQVERESEACVWVKNPFRKKVERRVKVSSWHRLHRTWAEAHDFLVSRALNEIAALRLRVSSAENKLEKIREIKEPTE